MDNKLRAYGETNYAKRTIRVNKKRSKRDPMYKRPVNKHAKRYPDLLDTIVHEELHRKHPRMKERTVRKKARRSVTSMSRKRKTRLYSLYG